jgi:hypothetical protein
MGIGTCAIDGLYNTICRNEETAAGGLNPEDTTRHADGFYRIERTELDDLEAEGCDRRVEIVYQGTNEWIGMPATYQQQRERRFGVVIRVGYFAGDHELETQRIASDDDHAICSALFLQSNWPLCTGGCVEAYLPVSSSFVRHSKTKWVLEIQVTIQVKA